MFELQSVVILKVNIFSDSDDYSLFIAQWYHLNDGKKLGIFVRIEVGKTQLDVAQDLNISQCVTSRVWRRFLRIGTVYRQPDKG